MPDNGNISDEERERILDELSRESEDMGLYDGLISDEPIDEYLKQGINKRPAAPEFEGLKLSEIVDNPKRRFWESVKLTLAGKTTVGLIGRELKNILKHVVPFGKYADATLDAVGNSIKTKTNTMDKPKLNSKSIQGILAFAITMILQTLGFDVAGNPELMDNIYHILYGLSGFWSVYGLRDALGRIIMKQDEASS